MVLSAIVDKLECQILSGEAHLEREVSLASCSDILSDVMAKARKGCLWITHQTHENVLAIAFFKELSAIILPSGHKPDDDVIAKAQEKEIVILLSDETAFDIVGRLYEMGLRGRD
jgi:predicted transcriptional regulator